MRELCRLTASSNDMRESEGGKERKRGRKERENTAAEQQREGGFRRMQPLSIDNPRPTSAPYAIATTTITTNIRALPPSPSQAANSGDDGRRRRLLAFLSINSSNRHVPISVYPLSLSIFLLPSLIGLTSTIYTSLEASESHA